MYKENVANRGTGCGKVFWYTVNMKNNLTVKQKKFVAKVVNGKTKTDAYKEVYNPTTTKKESIYRQAHEVSKKPQVQQAINEALELHGLTPEVAIGELSKIVHQDEEIGAKRLAIKDVLELHGWRKDTRPQTTLQINNSFFTESRGREQVDSEVLDV